MQCMIGYASVNNSPLTHLYGVVKRTLLEKFYWFQRTRKLLVEVTKPLLKPLVSDENGVYDIKRSPSFHVAQYLCSQLFSITLWVTTRTSNVDSKINYYLSQLSRDIFTLPLLSTLLDTDTVNKIASWNLKERLLDRYPKYMP